MICITEFSGILPKSYKSGQRPTYHMIYLLEKSESDVAKIIAKLGSATELARELTYGLYHICEQKKYTKEAQDYNTLVQSWPEISRLAKISHHNKNLYPRGIKLHDDR